MRQTAFDLLAKRHAAPPDVALLIEELDSGEGVTDVFAVHQAVWQATAPFPV